MDRLFTQASGTTTGFGVAGSSITYLKDVVAVAVGSQSEHAFYKITAANFPDAPVIVGVNTPFIGGEGLVLAGPLKIEPWLNNGGAAGYSAKADLWLWNKTPPDGVVPLLRAPARIYDASNTSPLKYLPVLGRRLIRVTVEPLSASGNIGYLGASVQLSGVAPVQAVLKDSWTTTAPFTREILIGAGFGLTGWDFFYWASTVTCNVLVEAFD